jgi:hypothetical protein
MSDNIDELQQDEIDELKRQLALLEGKIDGKEVQIKRPFGTRIIMAIEGRILSMENSKQATIQGFKELLELDDLLSKAKERYEADM